MTARAMRVGIVLEQALAPVPGETGPYSTELAAALARTNNDPVIGWTACVAMSSQQW